MSTHIDLHVHTTASDGTLSPAAVVQEAQVNGLSLLGITDHDTVEGIAEAVAAAEGTGLTVVPGVELSVGQETREIHVLGYLFDPADPTLCETLSRIQAAREGRNEQIISQLGRLGFPVSPARVREIAGKGTVGRPHIAKGLVEAGHVSSVSEAFRRFLARGRPAYVGRERLTPAEAAALIRGAGGVAVLAHPAKLDGKGMIERVLEEGMEGIEVYHSDHTQSDVQLLLTLARERALLVTGGSDSHGPYSDRPLQIGSVAVPGWVGARFLALAQRQSR